MYLRQMPVIRSTVIACVAIGAMLAASIPASIIHANAVANPDFAGAWAREDGPVAAGAATRTWLWGPEAFTSEMSEPYAGRERTVIYFDKARMEINDPGAERNRWYVTTGLLATEMMTGNLQTSDTAFEQRGPALIPVAGDSDDHDGPTYASFDHVRNALPFNTGATLTATIARDGAVGDDQHFARYAVLAEYHVPTTGHTVASVFWDYLNTTGTVEEDGVFVTGRLFEPWFYATGLPVTEAYWSRVKVGGTDTDVLIQVFERRVLTYTPANDPAWRVELGNVGRHYYAWRYERDAGLPLDSGEVQWRPDLSQVPSADSGDGAWSMFWDDDSQSYVMESRPLEHPGALRLVSRYWAGSPSGPLESFRITVDVRIDGPGEAGLGALVSADDSAMAGMVYFGVDTGGVRRLTFEDNQAAATTQLLRPAGGISGWNAGPEGWNTLVLTVHGGRVWIEAGGSLVGIADLPKGAATAGGLALVVASSASDDSPTVVRYRDLSVQSVHIP